MGDDLTKNFKQGATGSIWIGDREVGEVKELTELPPLPEGKVPLELGGSGVIKAKLRHKRKKKYGYIKKNRRKELRKKKLFKRFIKGALRVSNGKISIKRNCVKATFDLYTLEDRDEWRLFRRGDYEQVLNRVVNDTFNTNVMRRARHLKNSLLGEML